jgi:hypothetical protein
LDAAGSPVALVSGKLHEQPGGALPEVTMIGASGLQRIEMIDGLSQVPGDALPPGIVVNGLGPDEGFCEAGDRGQYAD